MLRQLGQARAELEDAVADRRRELEKRAEQLRERVLDEVRRNAERLLAAIPVATRRDLERLDRRLAELRRQLEKAGRAA